MDKVFRQLAQPLPAEIGIAVIGVEVDDGDYDPRGFVSEVGIVILQHVLDNITRGVAEIDAVKLIQDRLRQNVFFGTQRPGFQRVGENGVKAQRPRAFCGRGIKRGLELLCLL